MMNSYHYNYYYCYDYDDYPSYCCCSILLNVFLSLDEHDLLHLETSFDLQYSSERLFKWSKPSVSATSPFTSPAIQHYSLLLRTLSPLLVLLTMDFTSVAA